MLSTVIEAPPMFPAISIKGVLIEDGSVVLLENERGEWELPGGRPEPGEDAATCLVREFAEELGAASVGGGGGGGPDRGLLELRGAARAPCDDRALRRRARRARRVADQRRAPPL